MTYLKEIKSNSFLQLRLICQSLFKTALSLLAVFFLVMNTACNASAVAAEKVERPIDNRPAGQLPESYKPIVSLKGGMKSYSNVDPKVDNSQVDAKAERLINQANARRDQDTNSLKEVKKELDRKGVKERAEDLSDSMRRSAKKTADGVSTGTQWGFDKLKENAKSFKKDTKAVIDDLGQKARDKTDDI